MAAEISTLGRLGISPVVASGNTPSDPDIRLNFQSFAKGVNEGKVDANETRGELARRLSRVRTSRINVTPTLELEPTAVELARLLDWSMGASPSGTSYPLGNDVRRACLMYDDNNTVWKYAETAVGRLSLRCSDNDPTLRATLSLLAKKCVPGATFPVGMASSIVDETTVPFLFQDTIASYAAEPPVSALLIGGTARWCSSLEIDIDNMIDHGRFFNSLYLTEFVKPDRHITIRLNYPYGEYPSLYAEAAADAGLAVAVTFTTAGGAAASGSLPATSLVLSFANVQFSKEPVTVQGRSEVMHQLSGTAYRTTSTVELVTTLDSTP